MGTNGGAKRDRTADLLHAMQALSQLSYSPAQRLGILGNPGVEVKCSHSQLRREWLHDGSDNPSKSC